MVLGDDDIWPKRFEFLRIDAVDGKPLLQDGLDAGVDVVAHAAHKFRLRQRRQARYVGRKVAFMGTTDKELAGAERTDDLRRARDERNHAFGLSIGHLAQMLSPDNYGNQTAELIPVVLGREQRVNVVGKASARRDSSKLSQRLCILRSLLGPYRALSLRPHDGQASCVR